MPIRIGYLADHPQHAAMLARWHHDAWGRILKNWTVEAAEAELRSHTQRSAIPTTWIALDGDAPVGSVSLLDNDDDRIRQYSPWLASLYVLAARRGEGVGRALIERCVGEAGALDVPRLYLYTTEGMGVVELYRRLGWDVHDRLPFGGVDAIVMSMQPRASAAEPRTAARA